MAEAGRPLLAGVELGGTKCIAILGTGPDDIRGQIELPTRDPATTLAAVEAVFDSWRALGHDFTALGLAAFGPLNLRVGSSRYGWVARTPKPGWADTELAGRFARRYDVPTGIDTDVNAAARAEGRWGAAQGLTDFAYVTVGTGVGVGVIVRGRPVAGLHHAELGHIRVVRLAGDDFAGVCPFHGDCVEGLSSGPAIAARTRRDPKTVSADDPAWNPIAHTLAQLCQTLVLGTGAQRIFLGGGVMLRQPQLFPGIRKHLQDSLNGYLEAAEVADAIGCFIVAPGLGTAVGPLGALAVAADGMTQL